MDSEKFSAYLQFSREQWQCFRKDTPLTLTEADLSSLKGQLEPLSMTEIKEVYLPLSRLLNLYVIATQQLHHVTSQFLGSPEPRVPYLIGVAGSVAVGKSTTSRILQALLSRGLDHPKVVLMTTDGFLHPSSKLEQLGLMHRKGFPESYDLKALMALLAAIKSGQGGLRAPVYSHQKYDIVPNEFTAIDRPDIVIVEGLNILQNGVLKSGKQHDLFVSDFFDFTVYVDADTEVIKEWYVQRVLKFCETSFKNPLDHFHFLTSFSIQEQIKFAERVWHEINEINLLANILPYRQRARLILRKAKDHSVQQVYLRKL